MTEPWEKAADEIFEDSCIRIEKYDDDPIEVLDHAITLMAERWREDKEETETTKGE